MLEISSFLSSDIAWAVGTFILFVLYAKFYAIPRDNE
jgi:hypothetical protein